MLKPEVSVNLLRWYPHMPRYGVGFRSTANPNEFAPCRGRATWSVMGSLLVIHVMLRGEPEDLTMLVVIMH